ncbi:hypothetical protein [Desulfosoma caldarium]|uniref:Uncharacterized protein n=1 Tax=Desulfosoma caldarium TaxID=610254 RepID=A0A3N1VPJ9_9BACT|nr:hypothetical protein [Desulfosoma caldarium]ROR02951.1 hypothetical protein EDC27_0204 [Desulfosoma caldarium]
MSRRPDPLLEEFLDSARSLSHLCRDTIAHQRDSDTAGNAFEENVEGWVSTWYPMRYPVTGRP